MIIGLDLDNTIVDYDHAFKSAAIELGFAKDDLHSSKSAVKNHMVSNAMLDEWITLQGYVYGRCMDRAQLYHGVIEFMLWADSKGHKCKILSHKTKYPFKGARYNLHKAATDFIEENLCKLLTSFEVSKDLAFFETKEQKIKNIEIQKCDVFMDDLPEILSHEHFPSSVRRFLFDPNSLHADSKAFWSIRSWGEFQKIFDFL